MCMNVCLYVCMHATCACSVHRDQKGAVDPLKLEFQRVVKHHGVLGTELGPLEK